MNPDEAQTTWLIILAGAGAFIFLSAIGMTCSCICYSKKKKEMAGNVSVNADAEVVLEHCSEIGGATSLDNNVVEQQSEPKSEAIIEVELETTSPIIDVNSCGEIKLPNQESLDFQGSSIHIGNGTLNLSKENEHTNPLELEIAIEIDDE